MKEPPEYFPQLREDPVSPRGTVIVLNGLNTRPEALNQLANEMSVLGWRIRTVPFRGTSFCSPREATHELWLDDIRKEVSAGQRELPQRPVLLLGYSLGAMLSLDYYYQHPQQIAGLFLLAPPVALRWPQRLMLRAFSLSPFNLGIPSAAEPAYRLKNTTKLTDYAVLQSAIDAVHMRAGERSLSNVPLCVFASANDEFTPLSSLRSWFARTAPGVEPFVIRKKARSGRGMAHQIIDQASLEPSEWEMLKTNLLQFLNQFP